MSAQHDERDTAEIVDMIGFLEDSSRKRVATTADFRENATLLSIRQHLAHQATVRIDSLDEDVENLPKNDVKRLNAAVRRLLDCEFGRLRVYRHRGGFATGHQCLESLIAGLLRVQFHSRQISLPTIGCNDAASTDKTVLSVSWGVGDSLIEAEHQRLRHQRKTKS